MKPIPRPPILGLSRGAEDPMTPSKPVPAPPVVAMAATPRRWSGRSVAAALLVIVLGGLVLMWAVPAYTHRTGVLVTTRRVAAGAVLQPGDLSVAQVSVGPEVAVIPEAQRQATEGLFALVDLAPGTVLSPSLVAASDGFAAGQLLVPLALKPGQLPARGVRPGQVVTIVPVPTATAATATDAKATLGPPVEAVVAGTGTPVASTGVVVVDVRVAQASAVGLAQMAASGAVTLVLHPVGS